jgi:hypothetical protein
MPSQLSHILAEEYKKGNDQMLCQPSFDVLAHMPQYRHMLVHRLLEEPDLDQGQDMSKVVPDIGWVNVQDTLDV